MATTEYKELSFDRALSEDPKLKAAWDVVEQLAPNSESLAEVRADFERVIEIVNSFNVSNLDREGDPILRVLKVKTRGPAKLIVENIIHRMDQQDLEFPLERHEAEVAVLWALIMGYELAEHDMKKRGEETKGESA